jgi:hypothetical protein
LFGSRGLPAELAGVGIGMHLQKISMHFMVVYSLLFAPPHPTLSPTS